MKPTNVSRPRSTQRFQLRVLSAVISGMFATGALAQALVPAVPMPSLDPLTVPKYVIPLVIPPEMPPSAATTEACPPGATCPATDYNIAERQFQQQILPGGIWNALNNRGDAFRPTTVWSYGAATDPIPNGFGNIQPKGVAPVPAAQSSFNYPAFTMEEQSGRPRSVRWINELVKIDPVTGKPYVLKDKRRTSLSHLTAIDRTLHFANPERLPCVNPTTGAKLLTEPTTDCRPFVDPVNPDPRLGKSYDGPVPMDVHVHGAEVGPNSDGFPESWWLPSGFNPFIAGNPPLDAKYAAKGSHYDQDPGVDPGGVPLNKNTYPGSAVFSYSNPQPATTLWYHDHTLGMTANNVYAGPAGFWLVRGDYTAPNATTVADKAVTGVLPGESTMPLGRPTNPNISYANPTIINGPAVPGCDPNFDAVCRDNIREIPIALQDRSFNADGSLFYPTTRAYFDQNALGVPQPLTYKGVSAYLPNPKSDIAPIHNPEFFGNMIVVNGTVWPTLNVQAQRYRLRLLAGADARTFNLSLWAILPNPITGVATLPNQNSPTYWSDLKGMATEVPFYQIGAEQGFLPNVVKIATGFAMSLPGDGTDPVPTCTAAAAAIPAVPATLTTPGTPGVAAIPPSNPADPQCQRGLLMAPAERADVIVDFSAFPPGTVVRMANTGPEVPFNGFPLTLNPADAVYPSADPAGTGQIMEFKVVAPLPTTQPDDSTPPAQLVMGSEPPNPDPVKAIRRAALIEEDSKKVCVTVDGTGNITVVGASVTPQPNPAATCAAIKIPVPLGQPPVTPMPFGPTEVYVGTMLNGTPQPQPWANPVTETPTMGDTEMWEIYNYTVDAHPMHLHGARVQVFNRESLVMDPNNPSVPLRPVTFPLNSIPTPPAPTEAGYKDSVIALPGMVTRIKAKFEIPGLYVWHCHIVEHEDNEMMVPICIKGAATDTACKGTPGGTPWPITKGGAGLAF